MKKDYFLVLDAGTGAARCNIFNRQGEIIAGDYAEWNYTTPYYENDADAGAREIREFDPEEFWAIFCRVIRNALQKAGLSPLAIAGITSTSQREGIVLLNKEGKEIYAGPNIDFRGAKEAEYLAKHFGPRIYKESGHWPSALHAPARLLWFKQHRPDIFAEMETLLMINDWLLYRLTGKTASEPSNAAENLFFSIQKREWNYPLMDELGIKRSLFPPVLSSGTRLGEVNETAATQTGLAPGTPVYIGGADTHCAVLGSGGITAGHLVIVSGTSTPVMAVVDTPIIDSKGRVRTGPYLTKDQWVLDSNARPTGVVYRWLRDTFYKTEGEAHGLNSAGDLYRLMDEEAQTAPPGCNGLMAFLGPSILDTSNIRDFDGVFMGIKPSYEKELCNRGLFARSVLENIAFAVRGNVEQLYALLGEKPKQVYLTGGAAKAPLLRRMITDLVNLPVHVSTCPEATSLGAAICAAVGTGAYASFAAAVDGMVGQPLVEEPDPATSRCYEKFYRRWLKVYAHLTANYRLFTSGLEESSGV
ncbi:MAG: hypothetical protein GX770_05505 [Firmicutes bacterium]|nr:hypothetical protein [Bacillota bacterium]